MLYCQDLTPCNHYKLYNLLLARPSPLYLRARISYHYASIRARLPRLLPLYPLHLPLPPESFPFPPLWKRTGRIAADSITLR